MAAALLAAVRLDQIARGARRSAAGGRPRGRARRLRRRRAPRARSARRRRCRGARSWTATRQPVEGTARGRATRRRRAGRRRAAARPRSPNRPCGVRAAGAGAWASRSACACLGRRPSRLLRAACQSRVTDGWGARIRTWDHGTKTRCLTTWPRPIEAGCHLAMAGERSRRSATARATVMSATSDDASTSDEDREHRDDAATKGTSTSAACESAAIHAGWRDVPSRFGARRSM